MLSNSTMISTYNDIQYNVLLVTLMAHRVLWQTMEEERTRTFHYQDQSTLSECSNSDHCVSKSRFQTPEYNSAWLLVYV